MAPSVATAITLHPSGLNMRDLLDWFEEHARPLPWRVSKVSPWESLLAEIILQQTRMETGLPYWERIRSAYPTPATLANDSEENLLRLWQGCGYYARARNLYKLAQRLDGSELPTTYDALLELPGIGPYTAAAVASIAFGEAVACVDGNIRRVISRLQAQPAALALVKPQGPQRASAAPLKILVLPAHRQQMMPPATASTTTATAPPMKTMWKPVPVVALGPVKPAAPSHAKAAVK